MTKELRPKKIRVNSLNPGMIETEGLEKAGITHSEFRENIEKQAPLGRIGQPGDIGKVAVILASDDSGWIRGETIVVTGGYH